MFTEHFLNVIKHDGNVSIVTCANNEAHVSNTWNKYLTLVEDNKILIPAAGMKQTEANININPKVKLTLGSSEIQGFFALGTGYLIEGTAKFLTEGEYYDMMHEKFPFLTRVLEVTVTSCKQTL